MTGPWTCCAVNGNPTGLGTIVLEKVTGDLPTLTALKASTASAPFGQPVTFPATVSGLSVGGATPNGGTVAFSDQNGAIGSATLVDGVATFMTSSLTAGTNTVTAFYGGTADFAPSTASTIVIIIPLGPVGGTAPTRTVLTAQPRPANLGRPVTLTATVKNLKHSGPTPIGSVAFLDGTASLGTVALRHGKASLKTSSLQLGPNPIQADYTPSPGFAPSAAAFVENVRSHRLRSKAVPSAGTGRRAVRSTPTAIRVGGVTETNIMS
jgi:hypothetical protein